MKNKLQRTILIASLTFLGLSQNNAYAQTPTWAWATDTTVAIGGMATDAMGNVYVANGLGSDFLAKFDNDGNLLWKQSAIGEQNSPTGQDHSSSVALDPLGNILVSGYFTSDTMTFGSTNFIRSANSNVDMFVAKFDNNGALLWGKTAAVGCIGNVGFKVASDALGNVIVVGSYSALSMTIGSTSFTNPCTYNPVAACGNVGCPSMLVVKYDMNGNVLWAKSSFSGTGTSYAYSVATDAANNIYVGGDFSSAGSTRNAIVKYNSIGDTLWTQNNGGWFVTTDASGTLYSGYDKVASQGVIKKYDSSYGNVLWSTTPTGNTSNKGYAIDTDGSGNVYYVGTFRSSSITFGSFTLNHATNSTDDDIFIVKVDNNGTVVWAKALGGNGFDALAGTTTDFAGNVFAGGFFLSSSLTFDATTLNILTAGYNIYFAKLGNNSVTSVNEVSSNKYTIYPNPSTGIIKIEGAAVNNARFEIYNVMGELVLNQISNEIDLSNAAKGVYVVRIYSGSEIQNQRIVVQ